MGFLDGLAKTAVGVAPYALTAIHAQQQRDNAAEDRRLSLLYQQQANDRANATLKLAQDKAAENEGGWDKAEPFTQEDGSVIMAERNKRTGEYRPAMLGKPNAPTISSAIPSSALGGGQPRVNAPGPSMAGVGDSQDMSGGTGTAVPQVPQQGAPLTPTQSKGLRPYVKPSSTGEPLATVMQDGKRVLVPRSQAAGQEAPTPFAGADPLMRVQNADGSVTYVPRSQAAGKNAPVRAPGGMTGGMGSGGIGGIARQAGAITEMDQANQIMKPFEEAVRAKRASFDGLDYFQGQMAKMYDAHGKIDQAIHSAVFSNLNKTNPDLANYLRSAEAWALADGAVTGRTSDFRTRMDAFVSAIGPNAGNQHITNTQTMRETRLNELKKFQPAMEGAAQRFAAPAGRGVAPGNVPHPPNQNDKGGDINLAGAGGKPTITKDQADFLKSKKGMSDADIAARYVVQP